MAEYSKKLKWCQLGNHQVPKLWKSIPPACKDCWGKHSLMKSKTLDAGNKTKKSISPVSDTELKRLAKYRIAREESKAEHSGICDFPGCNRTDLSCHHGAGRVGSLLWNKKYFRWLCDPHHHWVEEHPIEAKEMNLSFTRTDK